MRFMTSALTREQVAADYVPKLKECASKIGHNFHKASATAGIDRAAS